MFEMPTEYRVETKRNSTVAPRLAEVAREIAAQKRNKRLKLEAHARRHTFVQTIRRAVSGFGARLRAAKAIHD